MAGQHRGLLSGWIQKRYLAIIDPLVRVLTQANVAPNTITLAGVVITALGAIVLALHQVRLAGLFILLGGLCDSLDGQVARATHRTSHYGAIFDATMDRYSEIILFLGIHIYMLRTHAYLMAIVALLALGGSFLVSYVRARAESMGYECRSGVFQRPERILTLGLGMLIHPYVLMLALCLVMLGAHFTAFQRLRDVSRQSLKSQPLEAGDS